jgi:hypothetical protein
MHFCRNHNKYHQLLDQKHYKWQVGCQGPGKIPLLILCALDKRMLDKVGLILGGVN